MEIGDFKKGEEVIMYDEGCVYSEYKDWAKRYLSNSDYTLWEKTRYMFGVLGNSSASRTRGKIIAVAKQLDGDFIVYAVRTRDGIYIIRQDGITSIDDMDLLVKSKLVK